LVISVIATFVWIGGTYLFVRVYAEGRVSRAVAAVGCGASIVIGISTGVLLSSAPDAPPVVAWAIIVPALGPLSTAGWFLLLPDVAAAYKDR